MPEGALKQLVGQIRSCARLRLSILSYAEDCCSYTNGRHIVYAVDTNIISLYINPSKMGPRSTRGGGGYGVVFESDQEGSAEAMGAAVSRFIFHTLTGNRPLVLLPGHDGEARRIYDAVTRNAERAQQFADQSRHQHPMSVLRDLAHRDQELFNDIDAQVRWIEEHAYEFFSYLFESDNPRVELRHFSRLISDGRIMRLAAVVTDSRLFEEGPGTQAPPIPKAFSVPLQLTDMIEESSYRSEWIQRLKSTENRKPEVAFRGDVTALARLEMINRRLGDDPYRLVLITGDEEMFAAAEQYEPQWAAQKRTFASLYLRHPRAFIATPEVLHALGKGEDDQIFMPIVDWLDTLLARYSGFRAVNEDTLRKIAYHDHYLAWPEVRRALRVNPLGPSRINKEWQEYTEELQKAHSLTSDMARAEIRRVFRQRVKEDIYGRLEALDKMYIEKTEETWNAFMGAVMRTGIDFFDDVERTRNPPALSFGRFPQTSVLMRRIMSKDITTPEVEREIQAIVEGGDTGYTRFLVYAVMYACCGRWGIAAQLAQRAIDIAERVKADLHSMASREAVDEGRQSISGREAYYFKAVAQRLLAQGAADLDEVERLLCRAEDALRYDEKRDYTPKVSDLRFTAERTAIHFTRYLFSRFKDDGIAGMVSKYDLLSEFVRVLQSSTIESDAWIRYNVEQNVLTSFFMLAAILEDDGELDIEKTALFRRHAPQLSDNVSLGGQEVPVTRLVRAISDYAMARFGGMEKQHKKKILEHLAVLENDLTNDPRKVIVMPYDLQRFKLLVRLTRKALS